MRSRKITAFVACLVWASLSVSVPSARASDSIPGGPQTRPVAIVNARVFTVSGPVIEQGTVVFDKGRITAVGPGLAPPAGAEVIDAKGQHLYPGLISSASDLGLAEIGSVRATNDTRETGTFNPNVRAERAVNPDSELIPVARANGVLVSVTSPEGGLVSGTSAVLRLDGWTYEQMLVRDLAGMHLSWPQITRPEPRRRGGGGGQTAAPEPETDRDPLRAVREFIESARAYQTYRAGGGPTADTKWEAVLPLLDGRVPLVVEAESADQIATAVAFAKREKLRLIISGGYDAPLVAPLLKENDVPVVVVGVQRLPRRRGDAFDAAFTVPARLRDAGVRFAIAPDRAASFARNLPYHAATAAAHGLTPAEALRAMTLSPAEIFGVADTLGSLDPGKEATIFLASGDILETPTRVTAAWTQGRRVDLTSHHTRLRDKYETKYEQQSPAPAPSR